MVYNSAVLQLYMAVELVDTRDIAKALRKTIRDESPPTLIATKFPGLH